MWFAAMSLPQRSPWFYRLVQKLLEGDAKVLSLLAGNPFPNERPKYIRAEWHRYRFTRPEERGDGWWKRVRVAEYLRPMSLEDFQDSEPPPFAE
jgi:hypothetical protein